MKKPGRWLLQADGHSRAREPTAEHGHPSMKRFGAAFNYPALDLAYTTWALAKDDCRERCST